MGAGPIGLELAVALKRLGVDYLHVDAGQVAQTISWYPRQARFFSSPERIAIAGVPLVTIDQSKATREDYLAYLRGVVQQFDLPIRTFERVTQIRRDPDVGFVVTTRRGETETTYLTKNVVLAIGDMHGPRLLHIPGEDLEHVDHYFEEPHRYFRQRLLIVGGRNSAVEAALRCYRAGAHVSISYRRDAFEGSSIKYWLLPEIESLIKHRKIGFYPRTVPTRITRSAVTLTTLPPEEDDATPASSADPTPAAASGDGQSAPRPQAPHHPERVGHHPGEAFDVPADFVLLLTGYVQDTTLLEQAGVELVGDNRAPQIDPQTMETNVPGLFIAGTAAAGTQVRFRLFIENCHPHVTRIAKAITGREPEPALVNQVARQYGLPES